MRRYIKFVLSKDEIITIIALLSELKTEVERIKDPKIRDRILDYIYENFNANDISIFNDISYIWDNAKNIEFENLE